MYLRHRTNRKSTAWALICLGVLSACQRAEELGRAEGGSAKSSGSFVDVTAEAGLGSFRHVTGAFGKEWFPEPFGSGGGFFDYDGDGWLDVLLVAGNTWTEYVETEGVPALRLYRNNGNGTFSETTAETGLEGLRCYGFGVAMADYDNDGDDDIFLTALRGYRLLRNDVEGGARRFVDVSDQAGVSGHSDWGTAALFFDADRDGWIDLYAGNYTKWTPETDRWCTADGKTKSYCNPQDYEGVPHRFYRNQGDGTFADRTMQAGLLPAPGKTLGVAELDYNRDGWPDLVVANDTQPTLLYENDGDGTFTERGVVSGVAYDNQGRARAGMGIDAADLDNSGEASIAVSKFSNETMGLYRHVGGGLFVDRAAAARVSQPSILSLTFGLLFFDADLDGYQDLLLANGHLSEDVEGIQDGVHYRQPPQLFMNEGDGTFSDAAATTPGPLSSRLVARGAAVGDYDRDGDLDVLLTENGGPAHLWRNELPAGRSIRIRLEGRKSNRSALGTRVVAVAAGQRQERRVRTGSSYLSQSEKVVTFGLGAADAADSLIVSWPSGRMDRLGRLGAGHTYRLVEGAGAAERIPSGSASPVAHR